MNKWIKTSELKQILDTYSVRKNEFTKVNAATHDEVYHYMSKCIDGYMITINPEFDDLQKRTNYFLVSHTTQDGHISFIDYWERKSNGLFFRYRNPRNMPPSDREIIRDLEERNQELCKAGLALQKELNALKANGCVTKLKSNAGRKPKFSPEEIKQIKHDADLGIPITKIAKNYGTSRKTVYKLLGNK